MESACSPLSRRRSEPGRQRFRESCQRSLTDPGDVTIRSDQHGARRSDAANRGKLPLARVGGVDRWNPVRPSPRVDAPALAEVEQQWLRLVQETVDAPRAISGLEIEVRDATSEQWM